MITLDPRTFPNLDVYGVIGNPIEHSKSPMIHTLFAKQTDQAIYYGKLFSEIDSFEQTVELFFNLGGKGLNVTVPFKERAYQLCSHLSARAKAAGVVNILWQENGRYHGDNSDGLGLVRDIEQSGYPFEQQRILLIGAGGAIQGVVLPILEKRPKAIVILNRTLDRAQGIVNRFRETAQANNIHLEAVSPDQILEDTGGFDLIINGTSAGLEDRSPLTSAMVEKLAADVEPESALAYDMVYGKETAFMRQMQLAGFHTKDGLGMLVEQAAVSFEIWRKIPENILRTHEVLSSLRHQT
jgi:shikimate dehydrogenase